ncbi:NADH-quinone oxidoreductase subunit K [Candidatus Alkanophaga liquidiphilum]
MLALVILLIAYLAAVSSKDLVRLLISLELMFGAVFLTLIPLFSTAFETALGIAIITIFVSSCELLILIAALILFDKEKKNVLVDSVVVGGEER